jgi:hypothetical protein
MRKTAVVQINPTEVSFVDGDALKRIYSYVKPCPKVLSFGDVSNW